MLPLGRGRLPAQAVQQGGDNGPHPDGLATAVGPRPEAVHAGTGDTGTAEIRYVDSAGRPVGRKRKVAAPPPPVL